LFEIVKRLGNRKVAAGCVNVGAIQVKKLQALCYWVHDQQKHGQGITQDDWDDDMVMATIEKMLAEVPAEGAVPPLLLQQLWCILISMQFWQFVVLQMSWIVCRLSTMKVFSQLRTLAYWKIRMCLKWLSAWVLG
jgi:hypothetical protein